MLVKGKKVGEYVLLEMVGAGGFGDVWKAEKRTEFSVSYFAIKFFRPKNDEEINIEAVKREVRTWQKLNGLPNIISVIEANRFENYIYIVSEFAEGGSLERWLKATGNKTKSHEESVKIVLQILRGLEGMHGEGFIHRDLKPANVLIKRGGFYLADFGISRQMKAHSKTNTTAGTYEFMPPEAFDKNPSVSIHTDIWATGAILQLLLTGQLPFPQDEIPSLITAILYSEPEPLPEDIPLELREIVKKALQKKREDRFQTASKMIEVLKNPQKFLKQLQISQTITIEKEDSDKTAKYEIAPTQEAVRTGEAKLRSVQAEINTSLKQQINEPSEQIDEAIAGQAKGNHETSLNRRITPQPPVGKSKKIWIGGAVLSALLIGLIGLVVWYYADDSKQSSNTPKNSSNSNPLKNSIGMEFVKIPAGSFMMGSPNDEQGRDDDETQHRVTISKDFYLGKYEVTQGQWKAIMGNNPSNFSNCGDNCAVENVSWDDVQKFVSRLNSKDEGVYRLPTEAEWEYACRAGTTGGYAGNLDLMAWTDLNSDEKNHPVGQKQPNAWGLYDMHGNVGEWIEDWYGEDYYTKSPNIDPTGPNTGKYRVSRPGIPQRGRIPGLNDSSHVRNSFRSANRSYNSPSNKKNDGFRLVRE